MLSMNEISQMLTPLLYLFEGNNSKFKKTSSLFEIVYLKDFA